VTEVPAGLLLRRSIPEDYAALLGWVRDADELLLFSGPALAWPLTQGQLDALGSIPGRTDWTLVQESAPEAAEGEEQGEGENAGEAAGAAARPETAIGHVDLIRDGDNAHLARVILAPHVRSRGLARPLILLALHTARALDATRATLNVVAGNERALRVYRSVGFAVVSAPELPAGVLRMERTLDRS
jgi:RimJ/RimL family protein N-acetyltransferase